MKIGSVVEHKLDDRYVGKVTYINLVHSDVVQVKWNQLADEQTYMKIDLFLVRE